MRRYVLNEPSVLFPNYPMGLTSAIHFLSINGYIIGKQLNYNKLTTDAVELATELFFSDIEKMSSTFLVCEAKGDVTECYELVRALYAPTEPDEISQLKPDEIPQLKPDEMPQPEPMEQQTADESCRDPPTDGGVLLLRTAFGLYHFQATQL